MTRNITHTAYTAYILILEYTELLNVRICGKYISVLFEIMKEGVTVICSVIGSAGTELNGQNLLDKIYLKMNVLYMYRCKRMISYINMNIYKCIHIYY